MKHLKHTLTTYVYSHYNICNIQIKTLATYVWKQLKYLEHTLETYMYSHWNMCNIPNLLLQHPDEHICNIQMKHLKHLKHIRLQHALFSTMSPWNLEEWKLIITELNAGTEVSSGAWSLPVWQRHRQLTSRMASREAPPSARGTVASATPRCGGGRGRAHNGGGWAHRVGAGWARHGGEAA